MIERRFGIVVAGLALMSMPLALGQDKSDRLTFDVASIRPSPPNAPVGGFTPLPNGNGYDVQNASIKSVISVIYRTPLRQISGGPEWLTSQKYDIKVRADHPYSVDDLHMMFQNLLSDRFKLGIHKETREGPVYLLTVAKSGLKMKLVEVGKDHNSPIKDGKTGEYIGERVSMEYLCYWLGQRLQNDQRPVIDKTSLHGTYNFTLTFRPQLLPSVSDEGLDPELESLPSIFSALKEQLGLELVPQKGPVEQLIIDSAQRPSDN